MEKEIDMEIHKRYLDEAESEPITETEARYHLGAFYSDIDLALEAIKAGLVIATYTALYAKSAELLK